MTRMIRAWVVSSLRLRTNTSEGHKKLSQMANELNEDSMRVIDRANSINSDMLHVSEQLALQLP